MSAPKYYSTDDQLKVLTACRQQLVRMLRTVENIEIKLSKEGVNIEGVAWESPLVQGLKAVLKETFEEIEKRQGE